MISGMILPTIRNTWTEVWESPKKKILWRIVLRSTYLQIRAKDNEVDVGDPRRPKALQDDEDKEEFDPFKKVKVGCCWYAAIQLEENQKSRQPKSLGFENQSTSAGGKIRGGRNLRKRRPRRLRSRKEQLPLDRVISSLNNLISKSLKSLLVQHHPRKRPVARRPFHRPG